METRGRKTIDNEALTETISLRFSKVEMKEIEKIANDLDMPKTRFMRNLVLSSLGDVKFFHSLGLLKGVKNLQEFKEKYINIMKEEKYGK